MSRSSLGVTMLLACSAVLLSGCHKQALPKVEQAVSGKLRLDGVTIVDTHDGKLTPGMSILMDRGRIVSITPTSEVSGDPLVKSIDATGRFAIPGFNNMHMHVIDQTDSSSVLARMLADGVTGFRQMTGGAVWGSVLNIDLNLTPGSSRRIPRRPLLDPLDQA